MSNEEDGSSIRRRCGALVWAPVTFCIVACLSFLGTNKESRSLSRDAYLKLTTKLNQQVKRKEGNRRPLLSDLVDRNESRIIGDVQFLLDFAIIASPKCGTSSMLHWIGNHDEVQMHDGEIHSLKNNRPAELVSVMYDLPAGSHYKRGYKAPNDLRRQDALHALQSYWPQARLIVGLRHPVRWMESFYNFRSQHGRKVPSDTVMKGLEIPQQVQFHVNLANLGKTNMSIPESRLLGPDEKRRRPKMSNKVFLYELSQPSDTNETRSERFRDDLSDFIGLSKPLEPLERKTSNTFHYAIDICDDEYTNLRARLVQNGKSAAEWIRTYFLPLSDVTVSSPDYFKELLDSWSIDPCDEA